MIIDPLCLFVIDSALYASLYDLIGDECNMPCVCENVSILKSFFTVCNPYIIAIQPSSLFPEDPQQVLHPAPVPQQADLS